MNELTTRPPFDWRRPFTAKAALRAFVARTSVLAVLSVLSLLYAWHLTPAVHGQNPRYWYCNDLSTPSAQPAPIRFHPDLGPSNASNSTAGSGVRVNLSRYRDRDAAKETSPVRSRRTASTSRSLGHAALRAHLVIAGDEHPEPLQTAAPSSRAGRRKTIQIERTCTNQHRVP
jgi:hypothetical protein